MTLIQKRTFLALTVCALISVLHTEARADDMMPSSTGSMPTDAMTTQMKNTTQPAVDKTSAMKASGDQAVSNVHSTASQAGTMTNTDTMTKSTTDSMMPGMTMGK